MRRGDIYSVNLGRGVGREFAGRQYVVVISDNFTISLEWTVVVLPAIDVSINPRHRYGILVPAAESGMPNDLLFQPTQIRALDFSRFPKISRGAVPDHHLIIVEAELKRTLEIR